MWYSIPIPKKNNIEKRGVLVDSPRAHFESSRPQSSESHLDKVKAKLGKSKILKSENTSFCVSVDVIN